MSIIAEFTIPTGALPGGSVLTEMPAIRLELERIVPTHEQALPFFWVLGNDVEQFVGALENESEIANITVLDTVEQGALVRASWVPDAAVVRAIKSLEATILEATGSAENWSFRIRARSREKITTFTDIFQEHEISVTLERIYDLCELEVGYQYALTPEQQEALVTAYEVGYFDKPRQVTQEELGGEFDITSRAVSDRLRRGTRNLIASTLLTAPPLPD